MSTAPPSSSNSPTEVRAGALAANLRKARCVALAAAVLLIPSLCLSACGSTPTLNGAAVERAIATSILTQRNLHATVVCPTDVPRRAGVTFTCKAVLEVGTYPISVTEANGSGQIRYGNQQPLAILKISAVERAISQSILTQRHLHVRVSCPAEVLQRAGIFFTCTATINGQGLPFGVTELDNSGRVRYAAGQ